MSRKKWEGLLASALIGVLATAIVGCSSSSNTTPNQVADAAPDARPTHREAGSATFDASGGGGGRGGGRSGGGVDSGTAPAFDGTSGKPCSSNADCTTTGLNVCSNTYSGKLGTLNGLMSPQLWPTPLCMVPLPTMSGLGNGNCDPGDQR